MQTNFLIVAANSATPISAHQADSRARSLQVPKISLSQITRCLDSASDNYQAGEINSYSYTPCFSKRYNIKVFNASLGVLGTQELYPTEGVVNTYTVNVTEMYAIIVWMNQGCQLM